MFQVVVFGLSTGGKGSQPSIIHHLVSYNIGLPNSGWTSVMLLHVFPTFKQAPRNICVG